MKHFNNIYDFWQYLNKPVVITLYWIIGQLSVVCYLNALDNCYKQFKKKYKSLKENNLINDINNNNSDDDMSEAFVDDRDGFSLKMATGFLFHSPYCKLVQKSFARLLWLDFLETEANSKDSVDKEEDEFAEKIKGLAKYRYIYCCCIEPNSFCNSFYWSFIFKFNRNLTNEETFFNKELEKELVRLSEPLFKKKTASSLFLAKEIGNMYTPSLYGCLASHLLRLVLLVTNYMQ